MNKTDSDIREIIAKVIGANVRMLNSPSMDERNSLSLNYKFLKIGKIGEGEEVGLLIHLLINFLTNINLQGMGLVDMIVLRSPKNKAFIEELIEKKAIEFIFDPEIAHYNYIRINDKIRAHYFSDTTRSNMKGYLREMKKLGVDKSRFGDIGKVKCEDVGRILDYIEFNQGYFYNQISNIMLERIREKQQKKK